MACGGPDVRGTIETLGGEACTADGRVCLRVPADGVDRPFLVRISEASEGPPAAIGATWEIVVASGPAPRFLKPGQVVFRLERLTLDDHLDPNLLRASAKGEGDWAPLANHVFDRVQGEVSGDTLALGTFTLLRADRLPDGGLFIEIDGGPGRDAGVIIVPPPLDAGRRDAGSPDAGTPDAGPLDAGTPDAGPSDAGAPDSGIPDAGAPDAGPLDAGVADAGAPDAGPADAGAPDAGPADAGTPDAGPADAGLLDAGAADAGDGG